MEGLSRDPLSAQDANRGQRVDRVQEMEPQDLKRNMLSAMRETGILSNVKTQLRSQLLSQLQRGQVLRLGPPAGDKPNLKRRALNNMISGYMKAAQYTYSLSVFGEESGSSSMPSLSDQEIMDVFRIEEKSTLHSALVTNRAHGGTGPHSSFLMGLVEAVATIAGQGSKATVTSTQTSGGDRYHLDSQLRRVEGEFEARLQAEKLRPAIGFEERMATYRMELEEQSKAELARQVERIREVELAGVRLEEAVKHRKQNEGERVDLERMHNERLAKLRSREEEMMDKLRKQQRDIENVAFEHRQKILREEERLRNWRAEIQQTLDAKEEQLRNMERTSEQRERAVAMREIAAEKKLAEATEAAVTAKTSARHEVEHEYVNMKAALNNQRMQLEMDRARIMELRSEAAAEIAAARSKEDRVRALETARAEAEARAAAHAADSEIMRLQAEKLSYELMQVRDELTRRVGLATDSADAMLHTAAGAMKMMDAQQDYESSAAANVQQQIQAAQAIADSQVASAKTELVHALELAEKSVKETSRLKEELKKSMAEAEVSEDKARQFEALCEEALASRQQALSALDDAAFQESQLCRDMEDLKRSVAKHKDDAMTAKAHMVTSALGTGANTPSAVRLSQASLNLNASTLMGLSGYRHPGGPGSILHPGVSISPRGINSRPMSPAPRGYTHAASTYSGPTFTNIPGSQGGGWGGKGGYDRGLPFPGASSTRRPMSVVDSVPGSRPKSPSQERLDELSRVEKGAAADLVEFRKQVAIQHDASHRDLDIAKTQVLSRTNSNRSSRSGLVGGPDDPDAMRALSRDLSISLHRQLSSIPPDDMSALAGIQGWQQRNLGEPTGSRGGFRQLLQEAAPAQGPSPLSVFNAASAGVGVGGHNQIPDPRIPSLLSLHDPTQAQVPNPMPSRGGAAPLGSIFQPTLDWQQPQSQPSPQPNQQPPWQQPQSQPATQPNQQLPWQQQQQQQLSMGGDGGPFDGSMSMSDIPNMPPPQPFQPPPTLPEVAPVPAMATPPLPAAPTPAAGPPPPPGLVVLGSPHELSRSHSVSGGDEAKPTWSPSPTLPPPIARPFSMPGTGMGGMSNSSSTPSSSAPKPPPGLSLVAAHSSSLGLRQSGTLSSPPQNPFDSLGIKEGKTKQEEEEKALVTTPSEDSFMKQPSAQDVEGALQARMRMLKEQQGLRMSQQKAAEDERKATESHATAQQHSTQHSPASSGTGSSDGPAPSSHGGARESSRKDSSALMLPVLDFHSSSDSAVSDDFGGGLETPSAAPADNLLPVDDDDDDLDLDDLEEYNISIGEEDGVDDMSGSVEELEVEGGSSGSVF